MSETLEIVYYPHPTLKYKSKPIVRVDAGLKKIVSRMFDLMYDAEGIGLAANQVALPLRMFVINVESDPENGEELVFINPEIERPKSSAEQEEGCLSLPGIYGPVTRPAQVHVKAYNLQGELFDEVVDGMLARVIQHEYDHIDGIMFPDRMKDHQRESIEHQVHEFELEFNAQRESGKIASDAEIAKEREAWEKKYC